MWFSANELFDGAPISFELRESNSKLWTLQTLFSVTTATGSGSRMGNGRLLVTLACFISSQDVIGASSGNLTSKRDSVCHRRQQMLVVVLCSKKIVARVRDSAKTCSKWYPRENPARASWDHARPDSVADPSVNNRTCVWCVQGVFNLVISMRLLFFVSVRREFELAWGLGFIVTLLMRRPH